jgi:hypothetical protein
MYALLENDVFILLSTKYKTEELKVFTIDEAYIILASYLNNPF